MDQVETGIILIPSLYITLRDVTFNKTFMVMLTNINLRELYYKYTSTTGIIF